MKIRFHPYGNTGMGYAVIAPSGAQVEPTYPCKETFAVHLERSPGRVVHFIRKDGRAKTPALARAQERVLHVFERKMGFKPLAKCEIVEEKVARYSSGTIRFPHVQKYFLYTVSAQWKKSIPLAHILALLTRNYYPMNETPGWRKVLEYFKVKSRWAAMPTIIELIENKGKLEAGVDGRRGITTYHTNLKRIRKEREREASRPRTEISQHSFIYDYTPLLRF